MRTKFHEYTSRLCEAMSRVDVDRVTQLAQEVEGLWTSKRTLFICGNGGSAGNAIHLANDFLYGAGRSRGVGIRVEALASNSSVITCLANDTGYDNIFAEQLRVKAEQGDLLLVLSGSGNSPNILRALEVGQMLNLRTHGILGFDGGRALDMVDNPIHIPIHDMQISEDAQVMIGHMIMQHLSVLG